MSKEDDERVALVAFDDLAPLWEALAEHIETLRRRAQEVEDAISVLAAVRTVLNAVYDLTEAWKTLTGLTNAQQNAAVRGSAGGEALLGLLRARQVSTHGLLTRVRTPAGQGGWGMGIYGAGRYGVAEWLWEALPPVKETDSATFKERVEWYGDHCESELLMVPVDAAFEYLRSIQVLDMSFLL